MKGRGVRWLIILLVAACSRVEEPPCEVSVTLLAPEPHTRSGDPDESLITDFNLYVFNSFGLLEKKVYVPRREYSGDSLRVSARLVRESPYIVLAAANLGYELEFGTLDEALSYRYHMAYPDEFSQGMPMAAYMDEAVAGKDAKIEVKLERLMSRVDLRVDRRALNQDVSIRITSVQVGNAASSVLLFGQSRVESWSHLFTEGYSKTGADVYNLNHDTLDGISGTLPLYLLESGPGGLTQPYIEIKADYHSSACHTRPGESLVYRFYITEDEGTERNCLYPIIFKPTGTGLECPDGWRLEKGALTTAF